MLRMLVKYWLSGLLIASALAALATVVGAQSASYCSGALGSLGWQCVTVDSALGTYANGHATYSLAGDPLIAYNQTVSSNGGIGRNASKTYLRYATRSTSGAWTLQTLDTETGEPGALTTHPVTGNPAIAYGCFKLAEFTGSAWNIQTVVSSKSCQGPAAFAYDQAGTAYAAYSDSKNKLVLGKRTGTTWSFQTVNQLASYRSMTVAPDGQPSIAFENYGVALMFGHRGASGAWQFTTVDPEATGGPNYFISHVTLLYDDTGAATIGYHNGPTIRYARLDPFSGAWSVEIVHNSPAPNWYLGPVTLADANGEPVIAFQQYNQSIGRYELLVTRKMGGSWSVPANVESFATSDTVLHLSAAYDPIHGSVGLSYGSQAVKQLRFADGPLSAVGQ